MNCTFDLSLFFFLGRLGKSHRDLVQQSGNPRLLGRVFLVKAGDEGGHPQPSSFSWGLVSPKWGWVIWDLVNPYGQFLSFPIACSAGGATLGS
jgi:hypothetical protein